MQKNWYAVYTKPHCEKKVSHSLTKRKIENFCPQNNKKFQSFWRIRLLQEPLFISYVFVRTTEFDAVILSKKINGILSLLYKGAKPAIINEEEINSIKEFTNSHEEIRLEKFYLNLKSDENNLDDVMYRIDGKILMIKNRLYKVNLPSLGFTMVAKMKDESIIGRETSFGNNVLLGQS